MGLTKTLSTQMTVVHSSSWSSIWFNRGHHWSTPDDRSVDGDWFDDSACNIAIQLSFHCCLEVMWDRNWCVLRVRYRIRLQVYLEWGSVQ